MSPVLSSHSLHLKNNISNMDEKDPKYLLGQQRELERLKKQHEWQQKCYKGRIVFAPLDLKKPDLHVLDMGCADGMNF